MRIIIIIAIVLFIIGIVVFTMTPASSTDNSTGGSSKILANNINPNNYGKNCQYQSECNGLVAINCNAEVDGDFFYVDGSNGNIVSSCGGNCLFGDNQEYCRINCPPPAWTCN